MTARPIPLLLTRPRLQAERFAADLARRVGDAVTITIAPVLEIVPEGALPDPDAHDGLVFTSENGLRCFAEMSDDRRFPAYCVGPQTTQAARAAGFKAQQVGQDAAGLVAGLLADPPGGRLLHLRGRRAKGDVAQRLSQGGQPCDEVVVYEQKPRELGSKAQEILQSGRVVILPVFSPRSARILGRQLAGVRAPLALVALSASVRAAWEGPDPAFDLTARQPDGAAMLDALENAIAAVRHLEGAGRAG